MVEQLISTATEFGTARTCANIRVNMFTPSEKDEVSDQVVRWVDSSNKGL